MVRGVYTSISSLITLEAKQGVITNNLVNLNTPGFKPDDLIISQFDESMISNKDNFSRNFKKLGQTSNGSRIESTLTKFTQGTLKQTDKMTDFSLNGAGFFTVTQGNREYYTRDGAFVLDIQGNLKTSSGASVMGVNLETGQYEAINLNNATDIYVDQANRVIINNVPIYRIRVSNFTDVKEVEKISDNLFSFNNAVEITTTKVKNRTLEVSEVDASEEMANLTNVLRSFESSMKVLNYLDNTLQISANEIGKV